MMQAGTYYIGDLCYVMHNEWDEFCELTIDGNNVKDGEFTLKDGRKFVTHSTAYGDGCYSDGRGGRYSVDSGLIGCILLSDIDVTIKHNDIKLGRIHTFDEPFELFYNNGTFNFGNKVFIETDDDI